MRQGAKYGIYGDQWDASSRYPNLQNVQYLSGLTTVSPNDHSQQAEVAYYRKVSCPGLRLCISTGINDVLPLDLPVSVGTLRVDDMRSTAEDLPYATNALKILTEPGHAREVCFNSEKLDTLSHELLEKLPHTSGKYAGHLAELAAMRPRPVLARAQLPQPSFVLAAAATTVITICLVCTYFAVAKSDGKTSRTIFNGKILKRAGLVPPPVNLLDIVLLLQLLGGMACMHVYIADIRGWFHVLPINAFLKSVFGIICGKSKLVFAWQVLPMGWAWSPFIAQAIGWALILRQGASDQHCFEEVPGTDSPPQYRWVFRRNKDGSRGDRVGLVSLLYDNIGLFVNDEVVLSSFMKRLEATMREHAVPLKYSESYPPHRMRTEPQTGPGPRTEREFPVYRGIQFGVYGKKRLPCLRLDAGKVKQYAAWARPFVGFTAPLCVLARYPGIIMWRSSMLLGAGVACMAEYAGVVQLSRTLSVVADGDKRRWRSELYTLTTEDVAALMPPFAALLENQWVKPIVIDDGDLGEPTILATDARGAELNAGGGWGWCVMAEEFCHPGVDYEAADVTGGGLFNEGLARATIFLQELAIAIWMIKRYVRKGARHLVIVIDNTGAAAVLRRLYSHNEIANRWVLDLAEMLREHRVRLRVVSVRSADNASDAASRDRKLTFAEYARCWKAVQAELAGWRQEVPTCWRDVDGGRDFDPEDMETSFPDTLAEFVEEEFGPVPEELTPNISGCTELISDALFENPSV